MTTEFIQCSIALTVSIFGIVIFGVIDWIVELISNYFKRKRNPTIITFDIDGVIFNTKIKSNRYERTK